MRMSVLYWVGTHLSPTNGEAGADVFTQTQSVRRAGADEAAAEPCRHTVT